MITLLLSFLQAKKPILELGVGMAGLSYPSYLGASSQKYLALPIPYIQYRGEMLQVDSDGVKKALFSVNGLSMDVSLSGSLPVDSASSTKRKGMEDLDFVFELGPKLKYEIWNEEAYALSFHLPIRAVLSSDFKTSVEYRGHLTSPQFKIEQQIQNRKIGFSSGLVFATEDYHDYFYGVDKQYEIAQRGRYKGKGGYGGFRNKISFFNQNGAWVYDAHATYYLLDGAVFEDSPLVEQKNGIFAQISLSYLFYSR